VRLALICAAAFGSDAVSAQLKTTAPGSAGDPVWQRTLHLSDGRTFVTDGGIAMDAALAKPASLPSQTLPEASAKYIERYLGATLKDSHGNVLSGREITWESNNTVLVDAVRSLAGGG